MDINDYIVLFNGYETGFEKPIIYDDNLKQMALLFKALPDTRVIYGFDEYVDNFTELVREFYERNFHLYDVPIVKKDDMLAMSAPLIDQSTEKYKQRLLDSIKDYTEMKSPFDIPLEFVFREATYGSLQNILCKVNNPEFIKQIPTVFYEIRLSAAVSCVTASLYAHEIAHSQLKRNKQMILDMQNEEVIPIFLEKLIASQIENTGALVQKVEETRFKELYSAFLVLDNPLFASFQQRISASKYIVSTLKATNLFDKYINGSEKQKQIILSGIQEIFDGSKKVESFLDSQNITFENSNNLSLIRKHL